MIMKSSQIKEFFLHIYIQLKEFSYLDKLLYFLVLLFLKLTFDTLEYREEMYKNRYKGNSNKIKRLMKHQPIMIEEKWDYIYNKSKYIEFGINLNEYLQRLERRNPCLEGIFKEVDFSTIKYEKLKDIVEKLNQIDLKIIEENDEEILENTIEEILVNGRIDGVDYRMAPGNDFTPKDISDLISELVNIKENEKVADLVCGSGGLLLRVISKITNNRVQIYGQEKERKICKICRLNILLHGIYDAEIKQVDTITENLNSEKFDVIIGNPPFSMQNNLKEKAEIENQFFYNKKYPYGIPPASKGDYAFIQNMLEVLKENGRMATIISLGALSRTGAEEKIRINMIKDNIIDTIILLPPNLYHNTGIRTAIMILKKDKMQSDILFIDASKNFQKGKLQNYIDRENIKFIVEKYNERKTINGICYLASAKEVLENNGNLSVNKYVLEKNENEIDIEKLRLEINDTEELLEILKNKKEFYINKLYKTNI